MTVLNHHSLGNLTWDVNGTVHGNLPLTLNVSLGYTPSSVMSTTLGALNHTMLTTGTVGVHLPTFHWADMIVFKR